MSMPRSILARASTESFISLAAILLTPIQRHYWVITRGSRVFPRAPFGRRWDLETLRGFQPFAEQHLVTNLEVDRDNPAGFVAPARERLRLGWVSPWRYQGW
jgi:hypothetical protein